MLWIFTPSIYTNLDNDEYSSDCTLLLNYKWNYNSGELFLFLTKMRRHRNMPYVPVNQNLDANNLPGITGGWDWEEGGGMEGAQVFFFVNCEIAFVELRFCKG